MGREDKSKFVVFKEEIWIVRQERIERKSKDRYVPSTSSLQILVFEAATVHRWCKMLRVGQNATRDR